MKTFSNERPRSLMPIGDGNWHYHYNVQETEAPAMENGGEPRTQYESDTVLVAGDPTVGKIVAAVVHESYTDEDIALMTAMHQAAAMGIGDEPEDYEDYLSLVVATRTDAAAAVDELESLQQEESETGETVEETEVEE